MIKLLNSSLERQAVLKNTINPNRFEEINGANTLEFSVLLDEKTAAYVDENAVVELDDDYFDIAYFAKNQNEDGTLTIDIEAEHVSYRLNNPDYDLDTFTSTGTPTAVLTALLSGTGFTVGTVSFSDSITYSAQEKKSRRMMLMELVALLGGEVDFDKFAISILAKRGSTDLKILTKGKNIKVVSKIYNKRERDALGNPLVSYACTPIMMDTFALGDEVLLVQNDLSIKETLRIVRLGYDPYNPIEADIELANFVSSIEDDIYRIETSTVTKEKVYNGCRIGPDEGFVAERSDKLSKNRMNATEGNVLEIGDGEGNYTPVFYVAIDTETETAKLFLAGDAIFQGKLDAASGTFNGELMAGQNYKVKIHENGLNGIIQFLDENNNSAGSISYNGTGLVAAAASGGTLILDGNDVYIEADNDVTVTTERYFSVNSPDIQLTATTGKAYYSSGGGASSEIATQAWVSSQGFITGVSGASGSFDSADGKTITVSNGLITNIV